MERGVDLYIHTSIGPWSAWWTCIDIHLLVHGARGGGFQEEAECGGVRRLSNDTGRKTRVPAIASAPQKVGVQETTPCRVAVPSESTP